jgi:hypothetical protein
MGCPSADQAPRCLGHLLRGEHEALERVEETTASKLLPDATDARQAHHLGGETGQIHHSRLAE